MSQALYRTRIYYDAQRSGIARCDGCQKVLDACPQIPGLPPMVGIDFAAETQTYVITPQFGPRRELEKAEVIAAMDWLKRFCL